MALHLHRAEDTGTLAAELGAVLSDPLPDPFASELVLVSARGMERWLSQQLSHVLGCGWTTVARDGRPGADGVCAGVEFRSPASLLAEITAVTGGDPWDPDALVWPLLDAIDEAVDTAAAGWAATLATHLGHTELGDPDERELRCGRRYAVARRLAGLFAAYAKARPAMLTDWLAGDPTDGAGHRLDSDLHWQPHLWRAVSTRIDADPPPVRQAKVIAQLRDSPADLPPRLSLFGHTRLAVTDIELLGALATHHDLHLWLPHPSDELWRALTDLHGQVPRSADTSRRRCTIRCCRLSAATCASCSAVCPSPRATSSAPHAGPPRHHAGLAAIRHRRQRAAAGKRRLTAGDRSVQVHRCHGRPGRSTCCARCCSACSTKTTRRCEPRDILVMCPDIETYAPLIVAAFGLG